MSRGPRLFKERDLARAIRSARAAGASRVKIEINKETGNLTVDVTIDGKDGNTASVDNDTPEDLAKLI
jgi:hypothetical protein